jgi:hypothetical protein
VKPCYWVPISSYRVSGTDPMRVVQSARGATVRSAFHVLEYSFNRTVEHYIGDQEAISFLFERHFDHKVWAFPSGDVVMEILLEEADLIEYKLCFAEPEYARLRVLGDDGPRINRL